MKSFSKKQLYLFSLLTGVLLWAGWPAHGFPFLLLAAFCPLLLVEEQLYRQRDTYRSFAFFKHAYIAALTWNILSTWWILNASVFGGILAIILNALFMALVLWLFHIIRLRTSNRMGYASLPILWLTFEYIHLNWECSWPWLTLGNGFANYANCVQWYEYTGALGGTLWLWLCNVVLFQLLKCKWLAAEKKVSSRKPLWTAIVFITLPLLFSLYLCFYYSINFHKEPIRNIIIVQPNIDPNGEKFNGDFKGQLTKMFTLADSAVDSNTDYLVFPETALTEDLWETEWQNSYSIPYIQNYLAAHPRLSIVIGAATFRAYQKGVTTPASARQFTDANEYYDAFNTALEINNTSPIQIYHKSKLVPGVEIMPFQKFLAPLAKLAFDLGGTSGTLGTQKEPSVFYSPNSKTYIAPVICYESIYGEYVSKYIQKGAQLIFIITNDGWWKDTPGYRQHLCYARLRAIETRRFIARSANTGISAFIDEFGDIVKHTSWWQPAVIKSIYVPNDAITFYVQYGDYIGRDACILSVVMLIYLMVLFAKRFL